MRFVLHIFHPTCESAILNRLLRRAACSRRLFPLSAGPPLRPLAFLPLLFLPKSPPALLHILRVSDVSPQDLKRDFFATPQFFIFFRVCTPLVVACRLALGRHRAQFFCLGHLSWSFSPSSPHTPCPNTTPNLPNPVTLPLSSLHTSCSSDVVRRARLCCCSSSQDLGGASQLSARLDVVGVDHLFRHTHPSKFPAATRFCSTTFVLLSICHLSYSVFVTFLPAVPV